MDQQPSDQLALVLDNLRAAAGRPDWPAVLLRFAADLTNAEAGAVLLGSTMLAAHPAAAGVALTEAWEKAAGLALAAGAVRHVEEGPGQPTLFALPAAGGALLIRLRIANPLHAALTRERLQLVAGFVAAAEAGARAGVAAVLGTVLPAALGAPNRPVALHRAATGLADLLRVRRVAIGVVASGRIRDIGVSDQQEIALASDLARRLRGELEALLDAGTMPEPEGKAASRLGVATEAMALLVESDGALPPKDLLARIADGLGPLAAMQRRARRKGIGTRHLLAALALLVVVAGVWPTTDEINAPFILAPTEQRIVTAPFDALLDEVAVEPGDRVEADTTLLARLSTRDLQLDHAAAVSRAANDRREADIARARGNPANEQLALLSAQRAETQVALLQHRIDAASIRSPLSGVVVSGDLRRYAGQFVMRGQVLFEVAPTDRMRADVLVLDRDARRLQVGARVRLLPASDPSLRIVATIERIRPTTEVVQGRNVVRAIVELDPGNDLAMLRAGTEGSARVEAGRSTWLYWAVGDLVRAIRGKLWI
nr:HlyD family efflux transporter periplasmic adaptor subunit [uncultured Roseococcus sp.]